MATIAACPKCQKAIAAPETDDPQLWVRCPLCRGEFQLCEALAINPPSLEFISRREGEAPAGPAASNPSPHAPDFPALHEVNPHLATHFASIPQAPNVAERPAQHHKHVGVELAKIILGGIAGLILGYAVLFWGFRVDPFHFAKFFPSAMAPENLSSPGE